MANKVRYGLKNVHYALATIGTDGTATYGTPVAIPGAVSISMNPSGEPDKFYADDTVYFQSGGQAGYDGDLEVARIPDSFLSDCLGQDDSVSGVLIETANAQPASFALMFEFAGDDKATKHVFYNCKASRPAITGQTKGENLNVATDTINISCSPIHNAVLAEDIVKAKAESNAAAYATWYSAVYQPTSTPTQEG